jgi:hypothetical protein
MLQIVTNMNETLIILHLQQMAGIERNPDGQTPPGNYVNRIERQTVKCEWNL